MQFKKMPNGDGCEVLEVLENVCAYDRTNHGLKKHHVTIRTFKD